VATLTRQLERVERAAQGARIGLELHAVRLEQELERIRARLAWRALGDQAKQLLLPPGSRRRAVVERVLAYAGRGATGNELLPEVYRQTARPVLTVDSTPLDAPADGRVEPPLA
jgi:hypothetical protein